MAWFNVDDSFYDHPKVWDAPDCAVSLWARAGSWSSRNLTDGFVPTGMPARFCGDPETAVRELVDRGLWQRTKGGYLFHDWTDWNSSKEAVKAKRTANARRQALFRDPVLKQAVRERDQDTCRYCSVLVRWGSGRSPMSGTYDHIDPAGENTYDNLVISCLSCNARKGGRTPFEAGMKVLDPPKPRNASTNASRNAYVEASTNASRNGSVEGFQSNPDLSLGSVVDHLSRRIAHTYEDDDLVQAIVDSIHNRTGQVIPAAHASIVAAQILEGRKPDNPKAYVQKAIASEKDPKGRFLPRNPGPAPLSQPPWCGKCDEISRLTDEDKPRRCPDCHPLTHQEAS